jgi:hypothetical protein
MNCWLRLLPPQPEFSLDIAAIYLASVALLSCLAILNAIPPRVLNVCTRGVHEPVCVPFASRHERALKRLLRVSPVSLCRFVT